MPSNVASIVFQCANCRALTVAGAAVLDDGGLRAGLGCSACGAVTYLPVTRVSTGGATVVVDAEAAAAATSASRALPASTAITPAAATVPAAPPATGAASSSFAPDVHQRIVKRIAQIGAVPEQAALADAFVGLLGQWTNDAEHTRFLKKAAMNDQLAFAGQRYRAVLEENPGDPAAKKAQNELMTLAMATLAAKKDLGSVASDARNKGATIAVAMAVMVAVALFTIWAVPKLLRGGDDGATMNGAQP